MPSQFLNGITADVVGAYADVVGAYFFGTSVSLRVNSFGDVAVHFAAPSQALQKCQYSCRNDCLSRHCAIMEPMHLLTSRSGELVSLVIPLCDDPDCPSCNGLVGLDSAQRVELATVADSPDTSTTALVSAAVGFLKRTGWVGNDPDVVVDYALDMAALSIEVASRYPPGTEVRAAVDRYTYEWTITRANQSGSNPRP